MTSIVTTEIVVKTKEEKKELTLYARKEFQRRVCLKRDLENRQELLRESDKRWVVCLKKEIWTKSSMCKN